MATDEGNRGVGEASGRPALRGSARGSRTKWRSFWAWREVEEEVVATVNGVGGDELRSGGVEQRAEEGERVQGK